LHLNVWIVLHLVRIAKVASSPTLQWIYKSSIPTQIQRHTPEWSYFPSAKGNNIRKGSISPNSLCGAIWMIYYTEKIQCNNLPCPISRFPAILAILFRRVAFTRELGI
jgi:hypothetical protein